MMKSWSRQSKWGEDHGGHSGNWSQHAWGAQKLPPMDHLILYTYILLCGCQRQYMQQ